jgi:calcium permeable stress-gated cation channel
MDPLLEYYIPDQNAASEDAPVTVHRDTGTNKLRNRFGHPSWTKPLMTPMVHAKANHLLPVVYHGRMGGRDDDGNNGQNGGLGKVEVIAERDLDYENFKVLFQEDME